MSRCGPCIRSKIGPESSAANPARKRRNSHHSAVFGEAGNGAVVGISELSSVDKKDAPDQICERK